MTPGHERLVAHLTRLKLVHVRDILDSLLEDAAKRELSYADFLDGVLRAEVQSKQDKRIRMGRLIAHSLSTHPRAVRLRRAALDRFQVD